MSNQSTIFPTSSAATDPNIPLFALISQLQTPPILGKPLDLVSSQLKPPHSYIGLIAMAILSRSDKRMLLSDVYEWISEHYPYFRFRGTGWRNSVRHNLSLNECFVKEGRAPNGKGHFWTIHPANIEDFSRGDFRRKHAQWKVKSHDVRAFALQTQSEQMRQLLAHVNRLQNERIIKSEKPNE